MLAIRGLDGPEEGVATRAVFERDPLDLIGDYCPGKESINRISSVCLPVPVLASTLFR